MALPSVTFYFDCDGQKLINSDGTDDNVVTPAFYTNNNYVFKIQLYNIFPAVLDVSSITAWKCGIGNLGGTAAPFIEAVNADFNLDAFADTANGKISIAIDSNSSTMEADLGSKILKIYYLEIKGTSGTDDITISLNKIYGKSTVYNVL